jgi:elongation factor Ts
LKKKGAIKAASKAERSTKSGLVESYIHNGQIGVLVEVLTETDFVAKNEEFKQFVHDVALHVAATNPKYVKREDVPAADLEKETRELTEQAKTEGKPEAIANKIVEGRLGKFYAEICLLDQPFVKNEDVTIGELLTEKIAKIGENIVISRFVRFELGK